MAMAWVAWLGVTGTADGVGGAFVTSKVIAHVEHQPLVMLDVGQRQGIGLGDPALLLADGKMVGTGRLFYLEPGLCGVRLSWRGPDAARADAAVVVSRTLPSVCRIALPAGTTVSARIGEIAPGHRTAWLNQGRNAGLLLGDGMLVNRAGGPVARADVIELYEDQALVRLTRLAPGTEVRTGDRASLWPSPAERRSGLVHAPVLAVESNVAEQRIWLAGGTAEGLLTDRRIEVFRGGSYVATAIIDQPGLALTRASIVEAYTRQPARGGDRAALLDQPVGGGGPVGRVFRIDGNYCLVSAGEDVGIRRGQRLSVVRLGRVVATLTVKTVKATYCGADIHQTPGQLHDDRAPRLWDRVFGRAPQPRSVQELGKIDHVTPDGLFASVTKPGDPAQAEPGTLVSIVRQDRAPAAAIIVHKVSTHRILHAPACWRDQNIPQGAHVLYRQDLPKSDK